MVRELLALLGRPDDETAAERIRTLTGAHVEGGLRSSRKALRRVGLEVETDRQGISTIWARVTDRAVGPIVKTSGHAYPYSSVLVEGLDENSTIAEARELLGTPEREGPAYLRYVVDGRYLHLEFDERLLATITLMSTAP